MLSCVHACSANSESHPRDLRWANGGRVVEALGRLEDPKAGASPWWLLVALLLAPAPRAPSSSSRGRSSRQWHLMRPTRPRRRGPGSSSSALSGLPRFVPLLWQPVWFSLGGGGSLPPAGILSFPALVAVLCWLWLRQ